MNQSPVWMMTSVDVILEILETAGPGLEVVEYNVNTLIITYVRPGSALIYFCGVLGIHDVYSIVAVRSGDRITYLHDLEFVGEITKGDEQVVSLYERPDKAMPYITTILAHCDLSDVTDPGERAILQDCLCIGRVRSNTIEALLEEAECISSSDIFMADWAQPQSN